jgi:hypothetical protein
LKPQRVKNTTQTCYFYPWESVLRTYELPTITPPCQPKDPNSPEGLCIIGDNHYYGKGVPVDHPKAISFYTRGLELLEQRNSDRPWVNSDIALFCKSAGLNARAHLNLYDKTQSRTHYAATVLWLYKAAELGGKDGWDGLNILIYKAEHAERAAVTYPQYQEAMQDFGAIIKVVEQRGQFSFLYPEQLRVSIGRAYRGMGFIYLHAVHAKSFIFPGFTEDQMETLGMGYLEKAAAYGDPEGIEFTRE